MDVLRVENLEKRYGRRKVVQNVSMRVGPSEIVGLLGPNGAGKSTSFRMTCGLVQPDNGRVFLGEQDVTYWPMFMRAREGGMGYLAQESSVFRKLTVEQNISAILEMLGQSRSERLRQRPHPRRDQHRRGGCGAAQSQHRRLSAHRANRKNTRRRRH